MRPKPFSRAIWTLRFVEGRVPLSFLRVVLEKRIGTTVRRATYTMSMATVLKAKNQRAMYADILWFLRKSINRPPRPEAQPPYTAPPRRP